MNSFTGCLYLYPDEVDDAKAHTHSLSLQQILLRGARLRNTDFIYGAVVYAGINTKIFRNLKNSGLKFSSLERRINNYVLYVLVVKVAVMFISAGMSGAWQSAVGQYSWYLFNTDESGIKVGPLRCIASC